MKNFMDMLQETQNRNNNLSTTENGAISFKSTGKALLDLNFSVPQLRNLSTQDLWEKWDSALRDDSELALRWLFFLRDVRLGLGERDTFRRILVEMSKRYPREMARLINTYDLTNVGFEVIPFYGRWDDLIFMIDEPEVPNEIKSKIYQVISFQLNRDIRHMTERRYVSLLGKWLPTLTSHTASVRKLARKICKKIGLMETKYRHIVSDLRQYINLTERQMSDGEWNSIPYQMVPSRAMYTYNKAFMKHDGERYGDYITKVLESKSRIHSGTLYPHEIVHTMKALMCLRPSEENKVTMNTMQGLWMNLPKIDASNNQGTIVVRDGSGSMTYDLNGKYGKACALDVADAMSIYFAEQLTGPFRNQLITFSNKPQIIQLKNGGTLKEKLETLNEYDDMTNTNIQAVFELILKTAVRNDLHGDEMPSNILIISDMEFDAAVLPNHSTNPLTQTLFETISQEYKQCGYKLPRIIFWNVMSRSGTIPMTENELGVCLISGFSQNVAEMVMSGETDPYKCMVDQIMSTRYDPISVALGYMPGEKHDMSNINQ